MAVTLSKALLLLLLFVAFAKSTIQYDAFLNDDEDRVSDNTSATPKRWYSVKGDPSNPCAPWPAVCPNQNWVRYCFVNQRSADNLIDIFAGAVAEWQPAIRVSALDIQPDPACEQSIKCICNAQSQNGLTVSGDTLRISDGVTGLNGNGRANGGTFTTIGYMYQGPPGRHYLNFGAFVGSPQPIDANLLAEFKIMMAHELGKSTDASINQCNDC